MTVKIDFLIVIKMHPNGLVSIVGVVVKLLACGARGPGFDFQSRRDDFRD